MAKFITLVMHNGPVQDDWTGQRAPEPAMFGMSADDDGTRTDPLIRNMPACDLYQPDTEALVALGSHLIVAVGQESGEELAACGARSVAKAVGVAVTDFPSHHGGFLGCRVSAARRSRSVGSPAA